MIDGGASRSLHRSDSRCGWLLGWIAPANVYYEIPLLNFVGWFVLMVLAPLAWIEIARRWTWGDARMLLVAFFTLPLLCVASIALSMALNGAIGLVGPAVGASPFDGA
jgi:hypothetical protein